MADRDEADFLRGPLMNNDPAGGAVAITPSDTLDIWGKAVTKNSRPSRGLYVGGTGDIQMTMANGDLVVRKAVPVGEFPWRVRQVWSTNTTATNIVADY